MSLGASALAGALSDGQVVQATARRRRSRRLIKVRVMAMIAA
jgi:hypothetical protein